MYPGGQGLDINFVAPLPKCLLTTNPAGRDAEAFAIVNGLSQLVSEPTRILDRARDKVNTLNLILTSNPNIYNTPKIDSPIGDYAGNQGLGLMRLHSTYRHDLKIYASDEGRVQMTAAAFAKGVLSLEGELTPILVQMVKSANTNGLLDNDCDSFKYQACAKRRLHAMMQKDGDLTEEDYKYLNPTDAISINNALQFLKNPVSACTIVYQLIQKLIGFIEIKLRNPKSGAAHLYHRQNLDVMRNRWGKLEKDFKTKTGKFDISKIPDIYDCIKYDIQHNQLNVQFAETEELYYYAKALADIVIPQEYGITEEEKLAIGQGICLPLLKKIRADLNSNIDEPDNNESESINRLNPRYSHGVSSPERHVRTRLYFTSESHIHSLLTIFRYGGLLDKTSDEQWSRAMEYVSAVSELNYMAQVVIMLYEDPNKDVSSDSRFHVELHFSPGVVSCVQQNAPPGPGFRPKSRNGPKDMHGSIESLEDASFYTEEEETVYENVPSAFMEKTISSGVEECTSIAEEPEIENVKMSDVDVDVGIDVLQKSNVQNLAVKSEPIPIAKGKRDCEPKVASSEPAARMARRHSSSYQRPHSLDENIETTESSRNDRNTLRRQRHSIPTLVNDYIQLHSMEYQKTVGSSGSLFSTAIISGSTSAPELKSDNVVSNLYTGGGCPGVPGIRPLETLHNALSLKQLDKFLSRMTDENFRTPFSSPPKIPSPSSNQQQHSFTAPFTMVSPTNSVTYSGPPSFVSSSGPSSPNTTALDILSRLHQVSEQDSSSSSHYGEFYYPGTMSSSQTSSYRTPDYSATPSPPEPHKH
ncbi:Inositol hexakisphosphate and diphosphoinositol-pentakisphosphate kinase [Nymphon striatum]|nr:Inositol hexakisphosphate and diphosphoinositol-pentakisphosphate kinase [Nymphon striatum]KAG1678548.1 Inositol hexakisphosphate and diphosphoinositol-pentakisphosphate kinase [Nymphon striatum]